MIANWSEVTFLPFFPSIISFLNEKWLLKIVLAILSTHHHTDWKVSLKSGFPAPKILNIQWHSHGRNYYLAQHQ